MERIILVVALLGGLFLSHFNLFAAAGWLITLLAIGIFAVLDKIAALLERQFRKGYLVYTHRNERGEIISYSGRDLNFETKWDDWSRSGNPEGKKPGKHRYVSGFHRGLELYGGQATRLQEPWVKESLDRYGLVIVEGMNDVMRLDELQVAAVGLGSNKVTTEQLEKLTRCARQLTNNRILLLPDCDEEGESGFKDLLWKLAEAQVQVRLGITSQTNDCRFVRRQPEDLTDAEFQKFYLNRF